MCYEVKCSKCGKRSWGGCGRHVQSVYKQVPEPQRCLCKPWPGVVVDSADDPAAHLSSASSSSSSSSSFCSIM